MEHMIIPSGLDEPVKPRQVSIPLISEAQVCCFDGGSLGGSQVAGTKLPRQLVPLKESITYGRHMLIMDAGLMHGRRSRVGWTKGWTMVHNGPPVSLESGESPVSVHH